MRQVISLPLNVLFYKMKSLDCTVCGKAQKSAFVPSSGSNAGDLEPIWRSALWVLVI